MKKYTYVEDYLEIIAGYDPGNMFLSSNVTINLARYDVNVISSMAAHTVTGGALTDRQAELAAKIVAKYQRQLALQNVDVEPVLTNPQYRFPIRTINRSKELWVENERMFLRFPYNNKMINELQEYKKTSQGLMSFDHNAKIWEMAITESNVNWACYWAKINGFEIDTAVQQLFDKIIEVEQTPYKIELTVIDGIVTITNAESSLIDYVTTKLGGFGIDNLPRLIDNAAVLGYTVDSTISRPELFDAFSQRTTYLTPSVDSFYVDMILEYAELANRYPVCIYDPTAILKDYDFGKFASDEVVKFDHSGKTKTCDYNIHNVKLVYARKIPKTWDYQVPLLVSTVEMLYGGKRMEWLQQAEKVIFYCNTRLRDNTQWQ